MDSQDICASLHSTPSSEGRCFFFTLPAELRNLVYECALTEHEGLTCVPGSGSSIPPKLYKQGGNDAREVIQEANPLQYVCRQLRRETKGLLLRFNNLNFWGTADVSGIRLFERFIECCGEWQQRSLRHITIFAHYDQKKMRTGEYKSLQLQIVEDINGVTSTLLYEFCLRNPQCRVIVRKGVHPRRFWLSRHAALRQSIRGDLVFLPDGSTGRHLYSEGEIAAIERQMRIWQDKIRAFNGRPFLSNLRITFSDTLAEADFLSHCCGSHELPANVDVDLRRAEVRRLFTEGC